MNVIDIESKIWNFSQTGTKVHAYQAGTALCRKSIKETAGVNMDHSETERNFKFSMCTSCVTKFEAVVEKEEAYQARLAASLAPSTGEGDYLPPAAEAVADESDEVTSTAGTTVELIQDRLTQLLAALADDVEAARNAYYAELRDNWLGEGGPDNESVTLGWRRHD